VILTLGLGNLIVDLNLAPDALLVALGGGFDKRTLPPGMVGATRAAGAGFEAAPAIAREIGLHNHEVFWIFFDTVGVTATCLELRKGLS
jgi:hypothetical protein